jgi:glutamyl-tRNA synthetase
MTEPVRVRFAPSPTGYLHLGSARTGLYNYIFARQHGGAYVLRIEDTDVSRSTDEAIAQILSSMREMGLEWDEGPERPGPHSPYRQTERHKIYHEHVERLRESGHLYPCFCTPEELEAERQAAQAEKRGSVYSGTCRDLTDDEVAPRIVAGDPYTLRFRVPPGVTVFDDMIREPVEFANETIGDFIVQRSDGTVTYNLAVVVDDVTMEITHVIRGDDHISNTPKQILIYQALDAPVPRFLHMPLLFGTDKRKLSKRHGATKLEELTAMGFCVEVVRNYLAFLSTEFDETMISWTLDDLVQRFDVEKLGTSASIFDPDKLRWMNGKFVREQESKALGERLVAYLTRVGFFGDPDRVMRLAAEGPAALAAVVEAVEEVGHLAPVRPEDGQADLVRVLTPLVQEKMDVLADFVPMAGWFFMPLSIEGEALERLAATPDSARTLREAAVRLAAIGDWTVEAVEAVVRDLPAELEIKPKAVFAALRIGMSGQSVTPGLFESLWVLGQNEAVGRLATAAALV